MEFSNSLIQWYLQNKRDLPWRNTTNPYWIWLSEIMLQQTRVAQGLPYFLSFTEAFPTIFDLANADEEQVLKLWQGLGYYSRARNLHATAKHIAFELNGEFPSTYKELLKLKGVGEYTAAAIASFSFEEPVAVLDGNVFRVLIRYYNVASNISLPKTKTEFQQLAQEVERIIREQAEENSRLQKKSEESFQQQFDMEKALKEAELKIKALNTLIDVAEEQLKIDIRKKSGAKQS